MQLKFSIFLYHTAIQMYHFGIWIASFFDEKAKQWIEGRQNWQEELQTKTTISDAPIWMHCASLGEFEQGRPLIEKIKKEQPQTKILLTFYSPSGFEIRKNYPLVDTVIYLPADGPKNAFDFLKIVQPQMAIFVKYEFWFYYLNELKKQEIPTYLVAAIFRKKQPFFQWYGTLYRQMLASFNIIFVQNEASFRLLKKLKEHYPIPTKAFHAIVAGDPRVDRVLAIQKEKKELPIIADFCKDTAKILVCGSTWKADETLLTSILNNSLSIHYKTIIAPHEINQKHLTSIQQQLNISNQTYSDALNNGLNDSRVLIIDNIGMLAHLYRFGTIAYIGGGFGSGIHNTLEPVAFGLPVIFGPKFQKFQEAVTLVKTGGGFSINNATELGLILEKLNEESFLKKASKQAFLFISQNKGATEKIYQRIF